MDGNRKKIRAEEKTEQTLNKALSTLGKWCDKNNMLVNTTKTTYQSFSLAHKVIHPLLKYKNITLPQTNQMKYLGVTFDNKLTWKNHVNEISTRASQWLNVLKCLSGSKWGCARSTLYHTYNKYILPVITYSCEALITARNSPMDKLELSQNQALRLITLAIKPTPVYSMLYITGAKPITRIIQQKVVTLHEKLIRLLGDKYWGNYSNNRRHLITQCGFVQRVKEIKTTMQINTKPQTLKFPRNPTEIMPVKANLNLMQNVTKNKQIQYFLNILL